jgi:hypothetical protein
VINPVRRELRLCARGREAGYAVLERPLQLKVFRPGVGPYEPAALTVKAHSTRPIFRGCQGILTAGACQDSLTAMARWGGGPETYRALNGPRSRTKPEVLQTFASIRNVRAKVDRSELITVRAARQLDMSWTEIAMALGVTRQAAWERFREMDLDGAAESAITMQQPGAS